MKTNSDKTEIGQRGEDAAVRFLYSRGFEILHRNWRSGRYEIDIIARRESVIHIVEVKCRRAEGLTTPYEALTAKKFESLVSTAQRYIEQYNVDYEIQFDLIAATHYPDGNIEIDYVPDIRPF